MSSVRRDQQPTGSPISPVSPWVPSKEYYEIEKDLKRWPGTRWFIVVFIACVIIALIFMLSGDDPSSTVPVTPSPSVTVSSPSPSFSTPPATVPSPFGE